MHLNLGGTRGKRLQPEDDNMAGPNKTNLSSVFDLMLQNNRRQLQELQIKPAVASKAKRSIKGSATKTVSVETSVMPIRFVGLTDGKSFTFEL